MAKSSNLDELKKIRESSKDLTSARAEGKIVIIVGMGTCGIAAGAREVMTAIMDEVEKRKLTEVHVQTTGCIGMCQNEPLVDVIRDGQRITYGNVTPSDVPTIIAEHVVNGHIVEKLAIGRAD